MGSIDEIIERRIHEKVKEVLTEMLEPVLILKDFEGVDVLTIDEMCKIFRREPDEKSKKWLREGCKRGEIPHVKVGDFYYFPKRQLVMLLLGEWKPEKKQVKRYSDKLDCKAIANELV